MKKLTICLYSLIFAVALIIIILILVIIISNKPTSEDKINEFLTNESYHVLDVGINNKEAYVKTEDANETFNQIHKSFIALEKWYPKAQNYMVQTTSPLKNCVYRISGTDYRTYINQADLIKPELKTQKEEIDYYLSQAYLIDNKIMISKICSS